MSNYHNNNGPFTVKHLADYISCEFKGDKSKKIHSINTIQDATNDQLAFVENPKYIKYLETTNAGLVIVNPDFADQLPEDTARILSKFVYADYSKLANLFYADKPLEGSIHKTAIIEQNVTISKNVEIKAGVVISEGAIIGSNTIIGANSFIGKNVQIGENNILKNNVSIECTQLGSNNLIHSGAKIGQDGFGFAFDARTTEIIKVPQVGGVIIGNYVEIGANTTIDRGSLTNTTIGDMTKLDNLVQIGHNVKIGRLCQIVAQSGIAGSTEIGDGCVFGGQSGVAGHLKIADRVTLASKSAITKNISTVGEFLGGFPAVPIMQWRKANAIVNRLVKNKTNNNK